MIRRILKLFLSEKGVSAVETALVFPLFVLLLLGTIDVSRYFWTMYAVSHASNEGVRMGVLSEATDTEVRSLVTQSLSLSGMNETPTVIISGRTPGNDVSVSVAMPFSFLFIPDLVTGATGPTSVTSTAVMQYEP